MDPICGPHLCDAGFWYQKRKRLLFIIKNDLLFVWLVCYNYIEATERVIDVVRIKTW